MSLADRAVTASVPVEWQKHSVQEGDAGKACTGPVTELITDEGELLTIAGLDPVEWMIDGKTHQWTKETPAGDTLRSFFFGYRRRVDVIDLPALYAEVARTKNRPLTPRTGERTAIICWADVQTGKVDRLGDTESLLRRLDEKRVALEAYLKRANCDRNIVADVGDIVEGFENVGSQIQTNDLSLMDQVDIAATEFWKTIKLSARYAPTDVLSIPSNHAQWRRGKDLAGRPTDDWGLHISKRLERMNEEVGLPVAFHRAAEWEETLTFDVRGTRLGLAHGHQAGSPDRVTNWWAKMSHSGVMDCDILLQGHFHHLRIEPSGRSPRTGRARWRVQCPTIDNGSAWVSNKMGEDGDPGLLVFQIDSDGFDLQSLAVL